MFAVIVAVAVSIAAQAGARAQRPLEFVPVGVRHALDPDPGRRRQDLEELRRLRFNVVALSADPAGQEAELGLIDRLLAGAADARIRVSGVAVIPEKDTASAASVRLAAWYAIAMGARGVMFGDWTALQQNTEALTAAVEFADHITRNSALYAPLRPRLPRGDRPDVTIEGSDLRLSARLLESPEALLLVVTNHADTEARDVTLSFSREIPEAIWQNMLSGAAVHFVAGPNGPVYTRSFAPHDVLVLMIRKRWAGGTIGSRCRVPRAEFREQFKVCLHSVFAE